MILFTSSRFTGIENILHVDRMHIFDISFDEFYIIENF